MKKLTIILLVIIIPLALFGLKVILYPLYALDKSVDTTYNVFDKTMTAENAIYNYEWFIEQEAHIRACLKNEELAEEEYNDYLTILPEDREKWDRDDKQEERSLKNSLSALQKLTNLAMEDYNAKSEMTNKNIFKDNLPSNMNRSWYAGRKLIK